MVEFSIIFVIFVRINAIPLKIGKSLKFEVDEDEIRKKLISYIMHRKEYDRKIKAISNHKRKATYRNANYKQKANKQIANE